MDIQKMTIHVITAPMLEAWERYVWDNYAWYHEDMPYLARCEVAEKFVATLKTDVKTEDAVFNFLAG